MASIPTSERTFLFELPGFYVTLYNSYLRWLKHLVERIGRKGALDAWSSTVDAYDARGIIQALSGDWYPLDAGDSPDLEKQVEAALEAYFPSEVQGLLPGEVRRIVESTPPFVQIREKFRIVNVNRRISAYQALQLRFDWTASLAETLMDRLGKEGELIVYDLIRDGRLIACAGETGSVREFIEDFISKPDPESLYAAALESEVIHVSEKEAIVHIKECEWARFFRENHPQVGYLMACSTDEIAYRAFNPALRLQRTSTLMEGGKVCDFRVFTAEPGLLRS